jgi:DivIVA domain-containing protein
MRGYERRAVDAFLRRCAASLGPRAVDFPELRSLARPSAGTPLLDAGDVRRALFPVALRGYDIAQVDSLLEAVAAALPGEDARPTWQPAPPEPSQTSGPAQAAVGGGPAGPPPISLRAALRGYDVAEVDAFLVRCAHSLGPRIDRVPELRPLLSAPRSGAPLRARDVETAQFRIRRRGYAVDEVDALLDRVAVALAR